MKKKNNMQAHLLNLSVLQFISTLFVLVNNFQTKKEKRG